MKVHSPEKRAFENLSPSKVPTARCCLCPARRGSSAQEVLHLRGYVSGWPRTRIGRGVGSAAKRPESFEHEGGPEPLQREYVMT